MEEIVAEFEVNEAQKKEFDEISITVNWDGAKLSTDPVEIEEGMYKLVHVNDE